jgi:hypothetical protein
MVRANGGWEVKRIAATPSEKLKYKEKTPRKMLLHQCYLHCSWWKRLEKRATKKASSTAHVAIRKRRLAMEIKSLLQRNEMHLYVMLFV